MFFSVYRLVNTESYEDALLGTQCHKLILRFSFLICDHLQACNCNLCFEF